MKNVIYSRPDGGVAVFHPCEGARLAVNVMDAGGKVLAQSDEPVPVDRFYRRWPVEGITATWAETEDEFIARVLAKSLPADATNVQTVDPSVIPADRTFRDAWVAGNGRVDHDMAKCKEIHRNRLRELRAPKLAALDADYMKALESGDTVTQSQIAAKKQALRDVTKDAAITAAKTPEELKAAIPQILK